MKKIIMQKKKIVAYISFFCLAPQVSALPPQNTACSTTNAIECKSGLIQAVLSSKLSEVKRYLDDKNTDINARDFYRNTALMHAVKSGNLKITEALLKNKPNLYLRSNCGRTALQLAVLYNKPEIFRMLLNRHPEQKLEALLTEESDIMFDDMFERFPDLEKQFDALDRKYLSELFDESLPIGLSMRKIQKTYSATYDVVGVLIAQYPKFRELLWMYPKIKYAITYEGYYENILNDAIQRGRKEIVEILLENRKAMNINITDERTTCKRTPLSVAKDIVAKSEAAKYEVLHQTRLQILAMLVEALSHDEKDVKSAAEGFTNSE